MSLESRISELQRRHQSLSDTIQDAERTPATDSLHVADLKKQKLALKEEIQKLQQA